MALGENIFRLRAARGLSQDALADQLGVSRQSVSKWETDASTPELDKLCRMAALFGVTLDELVTGTPPASAAPVPAVPPAPDITPASAAPPAAAPQPGGVTRRFVGGIVLLCLGFLVALLFTLGGGLLAGLLFGAPFALCGAVLLVFRRRSGLLCAWAAQLCVELYFGYATGSRWSFILAVLRYPALYREMPGQLLIGCVLLACRVLLLAATLYSYRALRLPRRGHPLYITLAGWALWLGSRLLDALLAWMLTQEGGALLYQHSYFIRILWYLPDLLRWAGGAALLVRTAAHLRRPPAQTDAAPRADP